MAEVAAAAATMHRGARHPEAAVRRRAHRVVERLPEARPARAAFEFGLGREEIELAARAAEDAFAVLVVQRTRTRAFRGFLAQHLERVGAQDLLPFLLGVRDLEGRGLRRAAAAAQRIDAQSAQERYGPARVQ